MMAGDWRGFSWTTSCGTEGYWDGECIAHAARE